MPAKIVGREGGRGIVGQQFQRAAADRGRAGIGIAAGREYTVAGGGAVAAHVNGIGPAQRASDRQGSATAAKPVRRAAGCKRAGVSGIAHGPQPQIGQAAHAEAIARIGCEGRHASRANSKVVEEALIDGVAGCGHAAGIDHDTGGGTGNRAGGGEQKRPGIDRRPAAVGISARKSQRASANFVNPPGPLRTPLYVVLAPLLPTCKVMAPPEVSARVPLFIPAVLKAVGGFPLPAM